MSNCCHDCHEHGASMITGVFTEGIYSAGDITLAVHKIVQDGRDGYTITIESKDGVQELTLLNGVDADLSGINEMLEALRVAQAQWAEAEEARVAAEEARVAAEGDPNGDDTDPSTRFGLYRALLQLQIDLQAIVNTQESLLQETLAAVEDARAQAEIAMAAAAEAATKGLDSLRNYLFITNKEAVQFKRTFYNNDPSSGHKVGTDTSGSMLNATGYTTEDRTVIWIKIPIGKSMAYVTDVTINNFTALIHNSGGYGLQSSFSTTGNSYMGYIKRPLRSTRSRTAFIS